MDPITYTLIVSAAVLAVAAPIALLKRFSKSTDNATAARKRAADRKKAKMFADTEPTGGEVLPLTREQEDTIRLIFEGYHPSLIKESKHHLGPTANIRAGVPVSMSAFDELNIVESGYHVEYLAPDYVWPGTNKHG